MRVEHGASLRHPQQLSIAREVGQALLRLVQPLGSIDEPRLAPYPGALLLDIEKSVDSGHVPRCVQLLRSGGLCMAALVYAAFTLCL